MSQAAVNARGSASTSGESASNSPGIWSIIKQTFQDWSEDNAMRLAAAMACYIMLALAPMIVVTLKVISAVPLLRAKANTLVESQVTSLVGGQSGGAIKEMVNAATQPGQGRLATVISLVIVVLSASGVFVSLQDALNTIWEVKPKPNAGIWQWIRKRFLSIGMVFGIGILLMSSMAVTSVMHLAMDSMFGPNRAGFVKFLAYAVDFLITVAVAWALFMGVFKFLPDVKITWRDVWFGALVTAILFKVGQIGMAIYFAKGSATNAYGAFGSIVAVLLWAYYSSAIVFMGAEFTQVWAKAHGREIEPEDNAVRVTDNERAAEGLASDERVAAKAREQGKGGGRGTPSKDKRPVANPPGRPFGPPLPVPAGYVRQDQALAGKQKEVYGAGAAGAALGAVAAGLATWYFSTDKSKPTRSQAAAVRLDERLNAVEAKLGRVSRVKEYLAQMDVKERIDRVEHEIHRAGRHVRAKETGRPLWMVRLGDLMGGRWSNL